MSKIQEADGKEIEGYELINPLPRWAYCDGEYADMAISSDTIIDGNFYVKIVKEKSPADLLLEQMTQG